MKQIFLSFILIASAASAWAQVSPEAEAEQARRAQAEIKREAPDWWQVGQGPAPQAQAAPPQAQSAPPQPDRWLKLDSFELAPAGHVDEYLDTKTIEYGDGYRSVKLWIKWVSADGGFVLQRIEMADRRMRYLKANRYSTAGAHAASMAETAWEEIVPGSIMETLYEGTVEAAQQRAAQAAQGAQQAAQQRAIQMQREAQAEIEHQRRWQALRNFADWYRIQSDPYHGAPPPVNCMTTGPAWMRTTTCQ